MPAPAPVPVPSVAVIDEPPNRLDEVLRATPKMVIIDTRDPAIFRRGHLENALNIPKEKVLSKIGEVCSEGTPVVLYCQGGPGSLKIGESLVERGYRHVFNLAGGYVAWAKAKLPIVSESEMTADQLERYSRHLALSQFGETSQQKLLKSSVLFIGAGGLGCPSALYLAAAGVGRIGIIDNDVVDVSNLQRQVLHRTEDVGTPKVDSAKRALLALNPTIKVETYQDRLGLENINQILDGYDVVVDGSDNFDTKYLVADACFFKKIPLVQGAIFQFMGLASVYAPHLGGPCYRCIHPEAPDPKLVPD